MLLEAADGRSAISKQAPVPLIAGCALLRRKRTDNDNPRADERVHRSSSGKREEA
jgi:hypothetical protein